MSNDFGAVVNIVYDTEDRPTSIVQTGGPTVSFTYDTAGRIATRSASGAGTETFNYTARGLTNYIDAASHTTWFAFDALGRKTTQTNANNEVLKFAYTSSGLLKELIDGKNQKTTWGYDAYGQMTSKTNAANAEILRFQYDANGRLTNRWSLAKANTVYEYDAVGNLANVNYPVSTNVQFSYDAVNRVTEMVDASGTSRFAYNGWGGLVSETNTGIAKSLVSYAYNNARLRSSMSIEMPSGSALTQTYVYDSSRRLRTNSAWSGTFTYGYKGASALLTNLAYPSGMALTNDYDALGRLSGTWFRQSNGTVLNKHLYTHNDLHQRTRQTRLNNDYVDYTYDPIGQLRTATGKESSGTTNRLHEQFKYGYDAAGNLNYRTNNALAQTFSADSRNQLTSVWRTYTLTVAGSTSLAATS